MLSNQAIILISLGLTLSLFLYLNRIFIKKILKKAIMKLTIINKKDKGKTEEILKEIAEQFKNEQTFILKLEKAPLLMQEKIKHFLYGICYAKDTLPKLVQNHVYVIELKNNDGNIKIINY